MSYFNSEESEQRYKDAKKRAGATVKKRGKEKYNNNPTYCGYCNDKLPYKKRMNKFCNHSCAAALNNKGVRRHGVEPSNCLWCGEKLDYSKAEYCTNRCQKNYQFHIYINRWKLGLETGVNGKSGISAHIRRYLHEKYDSKCQKCGWGVINEHTGRVPIQIHHDDGDFTHNEEENLELICPNCHSLTRNFGRRGNNNKRTHR